jgi:pyridoxal phosphate enzyme (YggS family)
LPVSSQRRDIQCFPSNANGPRRQKGRRLQIKKCPAGRSGPGVIGRGSIGKGVSRQVFRTFALIDFATSPAHPADPLAAAPRLQALRDEIAQRARDCGRAAEEVKLVAVTKTFSADEVWPTIAIAAQTRFGENRVQEAIPKWRDLRARAEAIGKTIELHLIGPLQTNKAREAVECFDVIETVDREKIATAIAREIERLGKHPRLFVEVNTGAEPQKAGVLPEDADAFLALCRDRYGLNIEGLMAIPPGGELASPHFALLGVIAKRNGLRELSMGMTADWPLAVQLGATNVRVGSAIFGARSRH